MRTESAVADRHATEAVPVSEVIPLCLRAGVVHKTGNQGKEPPP